MAETKRKRIRIYKLASEYNLSAEHLVEFLKGKEYKVKSIQSLLTDKMIADIHEHYKKDIERAEKHYQKLAEFNKKRKEIEIPLYRIKRIKKKNKIIWKR